MFKKKALLAGVLVLAMCIVASAQSIQITDISFKGNTVTVKTQLETANNADVRVVITKDGAAQTPENVYWMSEQTSNADGSNTFVFTLPDTKDNEDTTGTFKVLARADGSALVPKTFEFVNSFDRAEVVGLINNMTADDAATLAGYFDETNPYYNSLVAIGLPVDLFNGLGNKKVVAAGDIIANKPAELTEETLYSTAALAIGKEAVNKAANEAQVKAILEIVNPEFNGTAYNSITNAALKTWINKILYNEKAYATVEAYTNAYGMANILYSINNATFDKIENLLATNKGEIGIITNSYYSTYKGMKNKTAVNDKIVEKLYANPADNYIELVGVLEAAVKAATSGNDDGSFGGGGGGGGLGGGVGSGITSDESVSETVGTVAEPADKTPKYTDINEAKWAEQAISALSLKKIVSGTGGGKFEPMRYVTREEFVKMVVLAAEITDSEIALEFDDVTSGDWYYEYVKRAVKAGVINGESENSFGTGKTLTRQDMAVMVLRAVKGELAVTRDAMNFNDAGDISEYAKESIEKLYTAGLINGFEDNTFKPGDYCTRAMAAQIIYNAFLK